MVILVYREYKRMLYFTAVQTATLDGKKCLGMFNVNCDSTASPNMV